MSKLTRIDQYICIDTDQIIVDAMRDIIDNDVVSPHLEDVHYWEELQQAAKIVLKNYVVCDPLDDNDAEIFPGTRDALDKVGLRDKT